MPENNIQLTIVVSGQPVGVTVNIHQTIEQLIHESLNRSGNKGQPPSEWELRTTEGALIGSGLTVASAGLLPGMTLYLNPRAGAGGDE